MWFQRAAEAGHRAAARALGMLYLTGAGVGRDGAVAAEWFRRAADAGDPHAQSDLANLLLQGFGDRADGARSREWFEQAAASGDLIAAFNFGVCLAEGVGVDRDDRPRYPLGQSGRNGRLRARPGPSARRDGCGPPRLRLWVGGRAWRVRLHGCHVTPSSRRS